MKYRYVLKCYSSVEREGTRKGNTFHLLLQVLESGERWGRRAASSSALNAVNCRASSAANSSFSSRLSDSMSIEPPLLLGAAREICVALPSGTGLWGHAGTLLGEGGCFAAGEG